jgi:hypothetical protein
MAESGKLSTKEREEDEKRAWASGWRDGKAKGKGREGMGSARQGWDGMALLGRKPRKQKEKKQKSCIKSAIWIAKTNDSVSERSFLFTSSTVFGM